MPPQRGPRRTKRYFAALATIQRLAIVKKVDWTLDYTDPAKRSWNALWVRPNQILVCMNAGDPKSMLCSFIHELSHVKFYRKDIEPGYHKFDQIEGSYEVEKRVARDAERRYKRLGLEKRFGKYTDPYLHADEGEVRRLMAVCDTGL
jgi:hypothetical protein